jgi:phasin family protein
MLSAFGSALRHLAVPLQKMNQVAIAHREKIVAIQMERVTTYTNLGIGRPKTAVEVNDPRSFIAYLATQGAYATTVGSQVVADIQKLSQFGSDFMVKVQSVAQAEARAIGGALGESCKGASKKVA